MQEIAVKLSKVTKVYRDKQDTVNALDGIDLEIRGAGLTLITGDNGCGKSTLLNVIGGLDKPSQGKVEVAGVGDGSKLKERALSTGYIFQTSNLVSTLNVALNTELCAQSDESAQKALEEAKTADLKSRMPHELSIGQQQRACIARAIAKGDPVLLADEPTSSLDPQTRKEIADILCDLAKEKAVIVVTHYPEDFERVDRHIVMSKGRIVSDTGICESAPLTQKERKEKRKKKDFAAVVYSAAYRTRKHVIRFAVNLFMLIAGIACIVTGESATSYFFDEDKEFRQAASLDEISVLTDDYSYFGDRAVPVYGEYDWLEFPEEFYTKYDTFGEMLKDDYGQVCRLYTPFFTDAALLEGKELVSGRLPVADNEVVINKYLADMYIDYCSTQDLGSYEDVVEKGLLTAYDYEVPVQSNPTYRIVGITDDDLSAYEPLRNTKTEWSQISAQERKDDAEDKVVLIYELAELINSSSAGAIYAKGCGAAYNAGCNLYFNPKVNWSTAKKDYGDASGTGILNIGYGDYTRDIEIYGSTEGAIVNFDALSQTSYNDWIKSGATQEDIEKEVARLLLSVKDKTVYFSMLYHRLEKSGGISDILDRFSRYYYFDLEMRITGIYIADSECFYKGGTLAQGGDASVSPSTLFLSDENYRTVNSAYCQIPTGGYALLDISGIENSRRFREEIDENPQVISYSYSGMFNIQKASDNISIVGVAASVVAAAVVAASLLFLLYSVSQYFKLYSTDIGILMSLGKSRAYCAVFLLGEYVAIALAGVLAAIPCVLCLPALFNAALVWGVAVKVKVFVSSLAAAGYVAAYVAGFVAIAFCGAAIGAANKTPVERIRERA